MVLLEVLITLLQTWSNCSCWIATTGTFTSLPITALLTNQMKLSSANGTVSATGTILDDDNLPTVVAIADASANEASPGVQLLL
jgi:hypothetical protein